MCIKKFFSVGWLLLGIAGCSSAQIPTVPVDGDMDGRSWTFCAGNLERVDVAGGFICKQFSNFYLEVETHYKPSDDDIKFSVAKIFEFKILGHIEKLRSEARISEEIYYIGPIRGVDNNVRLYTPEKNGLRIEVHLFGMESGDKSLEENCQNYWLLMLTNNLYLRTANRYCQEGVFEYKESISNDVVDKIDELLEGDIYK